MANEGATDSKHIQALGTTSITIPRGQSRQEVKRRQYTPLGESLEVIFHRLVVTNMVVYPQTKPFDENLLKPTWYRENKYCEFHKAKGHSTNRCMRLKNYIQDLIDRGDIELEGEESTSRNQNLRIYKDPFPKHDRTPPPTNQG